MPKETNDTKIAEQMTPPILSRCNLKKHVAAIHVGGDLSLVERKLANVLLLNAYENLLTHRMHTLPVSVLCAMLGWDGSNDITYLQNAILKLASTPVEFNLMNDGKASWHAMAMISYGKIEKGVCTYSYADFLAEQLYNPEIYATINVRVQRLFESAYALALYENCLRYKDVGSTGWWTVDKYRVLVGATARMYDEFKNLNRVAIARPVDEINRVSDIHINPEFRRQGRKVAEIRFLVTENPKQSLLKPEQEQHGAIRSSELYKRLREHGIGDRLAVAWIMEDEGRARATVEYVESKAKKRQVRGSTGGYIRTLFESGADVGKSQAQEAAERQVGQAADEAKRTDMERLMEKRREALKAEYIREQAQKAVQSLAPEARLALAVEYIRGDGATRSGSWDEAKGDFTNKLERIQFSAWLLRRLVPDADHEEVRAWARQRAKRDGFPSV